MAMQLIWLHISLGYCLIISVPNYILFHYIPAVIVNPFVRSLANADAEHKLVKSKTNFIIKKGKAIRAADKWYEWQGAGEKI